MRVALGVRPVGVLNKALGRWLGPGLRYRLDAQLLPQLKVQRSRDHAGPCRPFLPDASYVGHCSKSAAVWGAPIVTSTARDLTRSAQSSHRASRRWGQAMLLHRPVKTSVQRYESLD